MAFESETDMDTADKQDLLRNEILDDAGKRASTTCKRAERDAKKIAQEANKKADALIEEALDRASVEAEREAKRVSASVPLEQTRRLLSAQDRAIGDIVSAAERDLVELDGPARVELIARLLAQSAAAMAEENIVVQVAERDRGLADEAFAAAQSLLADRGRSARFELHPDPAAVTGGVIARTPDGRKLVDNSVEARRERLGPELRVRLAKLLFQQDTEDG